MVTWIEPDSTLIFPKYVFLINMSMAFFCGLAMNILLFYLITKRTPKEMQSYGRIMRVHCVSDMLYETIQCVTGVHPNPISGKVYLMAQGFFTNVSLVASRFVFDFYFWSILFSIALLPIDFFYRYMSVCRNKELTNKQLFLMVFLAYFIPFLHAFPNSFFYMYVGPAPDTLEFNKELQQFPDWKHNVPSFSVTIFGQLNSIFNFIFVLSVNAFSYGVIGFTYFKIRRTLQENAKVAKNSKSLEIQRAVSKILVLQASLPLVVICLPVSFIASCSLAGFDLPHLGAYSSFIYVWLATVKPAATIIIVPRYRKYVLMQFCSLCGGEGRRNRVSSLTTTNTSMKMRDSTMGDTEEQHQYY